MEFIQALGRPLAGPWLRCVQSGIGRARIVADGGIKKGERIDFALKMAEKSAIPIEAKPISMPPGTARYSQLYRDFATVEARLAILINDKEIWFYSDIDEKSKGGRNPFFVFDLQNPDDRQVEDLARLRKSAFDIDAVPEAASNRKSVMAAGAAILNQLAAPDDDLVRFFGKKTCGGTLTESVPELLRPAIRSAPDDIVRNRIQDRRNLTFGKGAPQVDAADKKPDAAMSCPTSTPIRVRSGPP